MKICFSAIASRQQPFAENFFGALIRTITMALGEMGYTSLQYGNMTDNSNYQNLAPNEKAEIQLAWTIFLVFVFLFTLVLINLLNAIAFYDVQVRSTGMEQHYHSCTKEGFGARMCTYSH